MKKVMILFIIFLFLHMTIIAGFSNDLDFFYIKKNSTLNNKDIMNNGSMSSPWPMLGHDARHTGRSPYSTAENYGGIKWTFQTDPPITSSPILDKKGNIYFTSWRYLYALYPNGTEIWRWQENHDLIQSSPVISDDGTIYLGDDGGMLYAFQSDGTLKWTFSANDGIKCAITLDSSGIIYFCTFTENGRFYAVYPNGTLKWSYPADYYCQSNPAVGDDGTIYFASHLSLYAFSSNGTLKWKNTLGNQNYVFLGSPTVGDDGTVYIPRGPGPLYAFYPNGTLKWTCAIGWGSCRTPALASDGTIYIGEDGLHAITPDGNKKWMFYSDGNSNYYADSCTYAISQDGTIYVGMVENDQNCYIFALNSDGTVRWRQWISDFRAISSPIIASDGTIYMGSYWDHGGMLYALNGKLFDAPVIERPKQDRTYIFNIETKLPLPAAGYALTIGHLIFKVSHPDPENVTRIEFYRNGLKLYEDTTPPYVFIWKDRALPIGSFWITILAVNKTGTTSRAPIIEMLRIL
jgi:outer membrane protein assembly factor BamB